MQVSHSSSISNTTCCSRLVSRCHTIKDSLQPQKCIISTGLFLDYLFSCLAELPSILPRALIPLYIVAFPFYLIFGLSFSCPIHLFALPCYIMPSPWLFRNMCNYVHSIFIVTWGHNKILMYNSRQLYAYYQRLNKCLATGLYRMWIVYRH